MPVSTTAVIIGAAVLGGAVAMSGMRQQKKAARQARRAQEAANRARTGQAAIDNRARRAKLIRQMQVAQATAENVQATQGGGDTTTTMATGALATATTQGAVNLSNFEESGRLGGRLGDAQLQLGRAKSRALRGQAMTKLGGTLMSNAQRIGGLFNGVGGGSGFNPYSNTQAGFAQAASVEGSF